MKRFLVVADPPGQTQFTIRRAVRLGARFGARLDIVGFVYEHIANLPGDLGTQLGQLQEVVVQNHRRKLQAELAKAVANLKVDTSVEVFWEKRVAEWINRRVTEQHYDLVIKGGHRSETAVYTPTDWQLLRGSKAPVMLLAESRWRKGSHVMAAVDLGTRSRSKKKLNYSIVENASTVANALQCQLHVAYAIPFSPVLRDLDIVDKATLKQEGKKRAEKFQATLAERGIEIEGIHVGIGPPEKTLVNLAAKHNARLVVIGCVGRKKLAGRVIGNTAEKILRLLKADVLAVIP